MNDISHDNHPECGKNEYFIGNATLVEFSGMTYKTKRVGKIAYDRNSEVIKGSDMVPVFLDKKLEGEYYDFRPCDRVAV
jgi:hypothetical protein